MKKIKQGRRKKYEDAVALKSLLLALSKLQKKCAINHIIERVSEGVIVIRGVDVEVEIYPPMMVSCSSSRRLVLVASER